MKSAIYRSFTTVDVKKSDSKPRISGRHGGRFVRDRNNDTTTDTSVCGLSRASGIGCRSTDFDLALAVSHRTGAYCRASRLSCAPRNPCPEAGMGSSGFIGQCSRFSLPNFRTTIAGQSFAYHARGTCLDNSDNRSTRRESLRAFTFFCADQRSRSAGPNGSGRSSDRRRGADRPSAQTSGSAPSRAASS